MGNPADHTESIRVRFSDTDAGGIAHHSSHFRWMEECRLGLLRTAGFSYGDLQKEGLHLPVTDCSCKFNQPIYSEDEITVHLWVTHAGRARIEFRYEIRGDTNEVKAVAISSHAFTNDSGLLTRLAVDSGLWLWLKGYLRD